MSGNCSMADNPLVHSMVSRLLRRLRGCFAICPSPAHRFQEGGHRGQKGLPLVALLFSQTLWKFLRLIFPHTSSSAFKLISTYGICRLFALFPHPVSLPELPIVWLGREFQDSWEIVICLSPESGVLPHDLTMLSTCFPTLWLI